MQYILLAGKNRCPTLRGTSPAPGILKCRGKVCRFSCRSQTFFRTFNPVNPSYRYVCGQLQPSARARRRPGRHGHGAPPIGLQLAHHDAAAANGSLPICAGVSGRAVNKYDATSVTKTERMQVWVQVKQCADRCKSTMRRQSLKNFCHFTHNVLSWMIFFGRRDGRELSLQIVFRISCLLDLERNNNHAV